LARKNILPLSAKFWSTFFNGQHKINVNYIINFWETMYVLKNICLKFKDGHVDWYVFGNDRSNFFKNLRKTDKISGYKKFLNLLLLQSGSGKIFQNTSSKIFVSRKKFPWPDCKRSRFNIFLYPEIL